MDIAPVQKAAEKEGKPKGPSKSVLLFLVILFALTTLVIAITLIIVVLNLDNKNSTATTKSVEDVCLTEGCVLAAARVRNSMDTSVDPCDDFYQFACGSWLKQNVIPEDKSSYKILNHLDDEVSFKVKGLLEEENKASENEAVHKAKDYYKACVNEERIEELGMDHFLSYLEDLGGWPVMGSHRGGNWKSATYNLEDLMIRVRHETNYLRLADIYVAQDDKNPTKYILKIDQTGLGMYSRDYYLKGRNDSRLMAYQKRMADLAIAFGADQDIAEQDAKDLVDFEIELAKPLNKIFSSYDGWEIMYLNYGGIGFTIGHEITHGFDKIGRHYDKFGNLHSWWSDVDAKKFKEKAQCMIDQYNRYIVPGTGNMTINGITTLNENIADNGGLKQSYRAYQKWVKVNGKEPKLPGLPYSANQLFFLNAAQIWCAKYRDSAKIHAVRTYYHSIGMFRVYGSLHNSEEFAQAFKCPVDSKMNPKRKCAVW